MSEFKGTKGKWIIDYGLSKGHIKSVNESNSNTPTVARYDIFHDVDREHEQRYNAQLISKAPEMLEMLKEAKRVICSMKLSMWVHPDCSKDSEFYDMATTGEETEEKIEDLIKEATTI